MPTHKQCNQCSAAVPNDKFSLIRAHEDGWFFQKDGTSYCPHDLPDWVGPWRERQQQQRKQLPTMTLSEFMTQLSGIEIPADALVRVILSSGRAQPVSEVHYDPTTQTIDIHL